MSNNHAPQPDPAPRVSRTRVAVYLVGTSITTAVRACLGAHSTWTLVRQPYHDPKPGPLAARPALRCALADAHAGAFDILVVDRISQLSRSIDELAGILDSLDAAGATVHSTAEPTLPITTPAQMFLHILGRLADTERDRTSPPPKLGRWLRCRRVR